jgi:iron(III) transport system ATP-binding protein
MATWLEVENIGVAYQRQAVVTDVGFSLEEGQIGCLLGPSGCGKTTLLRAIAGFEPITGGSIRLHGERVSAASFSVPPEKRRVGMLFQDLALFPHLNIADNVGFGLHGLAPSARAARVRELLALADLDSHGHRYPHQLSGGQQQRVALARALAPRPEMLLLDEPFSTLDAELREELASQVRYILKQEGLTALLVTHDQYEAFAVADEIGLMRDGRIVQWDSAYNLYHRPASRFAASFVGLGVMLPGVVLNEREVQTELGILNGRVDARFRPSEPVEILVRPDDIQHNDASPLLATIERRQFRGAEFLYNLRLESGAKLLCFAPSHHNHKIGERIGIETQLEHLVMFKRETA